MEKDPFEHTHTALRMLKEEAKCVLFFVFFCFIITPYALYLAPIFHFTLQYIHKCTISSTVEHHHRIVTCSILPCFQPLSSLSLCYTHTQSPCRGWTWAVFPDVIKCGLSRATLPHFTLLPLLLRPGPVITTYQSLRATSTPAGKKRAPGPSHEASLLSPCQSSPLRKRDSSEPRRITWIENVSSFTWWTDVRSLALGSHEFTSQMLREFRADILKRNCPFSKMVSGWASAEFPHGLSAVFISFLCSLTWPARRLLVQSIFFQSAIG